MNIKKVHIFGGGTISHVSNHLAIAASAYGSTARMLQTFCKQRFEDCDVHLELTKMAGGDSMETNEDVAKRVDYLITLPSTKVVFFNTTLCDYEPYELTRFPEDTSLMPNSSNLFGKYTERLSTKEVPELTLDLRVRKKIVPTIRQFRKDIFLVAFKATCGDTKQKMFEKGLALCKEASVNLVLVNDTKTKWNMIVTPEEAVYHEGESRELILKQLVDMAYYRSQLTFTQSTVLEGIPVAWSDERVPQSLRTVVNYCVAERAYKVFKDATVGHFAVKLSDTEFLTSIRKSNFNNLDKVGLVYVRTNGPDTVLAYGAKPSVGGQSQRIVFNDHPGMDCIVHFHCPIRKDAPDDIPVKSQREVECGSHQCGKQTSEGLKQFGNLKAVYLDNHGPNIVFNSSIDPQEVITFIEKNFNLAGKTGGYNL